MNKRTFLRVLIVALIALLPLAAASPAYADAPLIVKTDLDYSTTFLPGTPDNSCSFPIDFRIRITSRTHYWFDRDGQWIRYQDNMGGAMVTFSANGKKLTAQGSELFRSIPQSPSENIVTVNGNIWSMTIPGYGIVRGSAGQFVYREFVDPVTREVLGIEVISQVGVNMGDPNIDNLVCAYLAP